MSNNIILNKRLEEYNKKYRNGRYKLLKYTKKEVEEYDKLANKTYKTKNYLLQGRKWALIGDTYYEIPRAPRALWFRNLNAGVKTATCALVGGAVAGGAGYGIYVAATNKQPVKPDPGPEPEPEPVVDREIVIHDRMASDLMISNKQKTSDGIKCKIDKIDQSAEINSIVEIKIGEETLEESSDYSFDISTKELTIFNSALEAHQGKIIVKPSYSHDVNDETFTEDFNEASEAMQDACDDFIQQTQSGTTMVGSDGGQIEFSDMRYSKTEDNTWEVTVNAPTISAYPTLIGGGEYTNVMQTLVPQLRETYGSNKVSLRENNPEGLIITAFNQSNDVAEKYIFNNSCYLVYYYKNDFSGNVTEFGVEYSETPTQIQDDEFYTTMSFPTTTTTEVGEVSNCGIPEHLISERPEFIDIPESVLQIGGAGEQNQNIVTSIADDAYKVSDSRNPYSFTKVDIPCTVKTIGNSAFENNSQIEQINFELNNSQLESIGEKAFSCCSGLTSVHIPSKITTIGSGAFKLNTYSEGKGIKTVYIDSTTVANFDRVAADDTYLYKASPKVYVKESITLGDESYIKQYFEQKETTGGYVVYEKIAFVDYLKYTKLTGASTPSVKVEFDNDGIMTVPTTLNIPSTIDGTFFGESKQNTYKVTEIVTDGFNATTHTRCANIEHIQLGSNVDYISSSAFANLTKLKSINIPTLVTNICTNAFDGCNDTDFSVTFEDHTSDWDLGDQITISHTALQDAKAAGTFLNSTYKDRNWSKKVEPISEYLTYREIGTTGTYSVKVAEGKSVIVPNAVVIPETYKGGNVVGIDENGFKDRMMITSVTLPKTLTIIGANAFSGCTGLTQPESAGVIFNTECQSGWKQTGEYTTILDVSDPVFNATNLTATEDGSWRATGIERTNSGNTINLDYSPKGFGKDVSTTKFEGGQTWKIVADYTNAGKNPTSIECMSFLDKTLQPSVDISSYVYSFTCAYTSVDGTTTTLQPSYAPGSKTKIYFNYKNEAATRYSNGIITMTITLRDELPKDTIKNISFYTPEA